MDIISKISRFIGGLVVIVFQLIGLIFLVKMLFSGIEYLKTLFTDMFLNINSVFKKYKSSSKKEDEYEVEYNRNGKKILVVRAEEVKDYSNLSYKELMELTKIERERRSTKIVSLKSELVKKTHSFKFRNKFDVEIYTIPKNTWVDELLTFNYALSLTYMEYHKGKPLKIYVKEELINYGDPELINFMIYHEIGHKLIPSNFGGIDYVMGETFLTSYNRQTSIDNIKNYLKENGYKFPFFDISLEDIEIETIEDACNIFAYLSTGYTKLFEDWAENPILAVGNSDRKINMQNSYYVFKSWKQAKRLLSYTKNNSFRIRKGEFFRLKTL